MADPNHRTKQHEANHQNWLWKRPQSIADAEATSPSSAFSILTLSTACSDDKLSQDIAQEKDTKVRTVEYMGRKVRRLHGLQWPWHPQQVLGWVGITLVVVSMYALVIPAIHSSLFMPLVLLTAFLFLIHTILHLLSLVIDPGHPNVRKTNVKRIIPEFDRTVHSHVIEDGRCHLCNISITCSRTKHCSSCNKCIDGFDHHCKWLNNCIGRRNYYIFLSVVITGILSCLTVMSICITEIALFYFNRKYLSPWETRNESSIAINGDNNKLNRSTEILTCTEGSSHCNFSVFGYYYIYDGAFIGIVSALFAVMLIASALMVHLILFHCYLFALGLTTYEYIRGINRFDKSRASSKLDNVNTQNIRCGWGGGRTDPRNRITPSSTTESVLVSPDQPSLKSVTPSNLSPRSPDSESPSDSSKNLLLLSGRHLMIHHKNSSHSSLTDGKIDHPSSVPSLPRINMIDNKKISSNKVRFLNNIPGLDGEDYSSDDEDIVPTAHLVQLPRPHRTLSRRRLRSSVAPHLSPIKECDMASSSPPSVKIPAGCSTKVSPSSSSQKPKFKSSSKSPKYSSKSKGNNKSHSNSKVSPSSSENISLWRDNHGRDSSVDIHVIRLPRNDSLSKLACDLDANKPGVLLTGKFSISSSKNSNESYNSIILEKVPGNKKSSINEKFIVKNSPRKSSPSIEKSPSRFKKKYESRAKIKPTILKSPRVSDASSVDENYFKTSSSFSNDSSNSIRVKLAVNNSVCNNAKGSIDTDLGLIPIIRSSSDSLLRNMNELGNAEVLKINPTVKKILI